MHTLTRMRRELFETPERLLDQQAANRDVIPSIAAQINARNGAPWWFAARGSSAHAGTWFAAAAVLAAGRLVGEIAPSLFTVYARRPPLDGAVLTAISQSGMGSDINAVVAAANGSGALTLGLTNNTESQLAATASHVIDLAMGPENAVAATKTYLGTLAAAARVVAAVAANRELANAIERLPEQLAWCRDNGRFLDGAALATFAGAGCVLGRGLGLGIAREVALKFKEVCMLSVEAFSAAEFIHGPLTLIGPGTPVLLICLDDATRTGVIKTAVRLAGLGARVTLLGTGLEAVDSCANLDIINRPATGNVYTDAIALAFDCYSALEARAVVLGYDPDQPRNLSKVTSTY